jgi:N-acetylglucosaminyldiphosphoundecaprenol N-acetyl-beta-D-mannosaminyltransferase
MINTVSTYDILGVKVSALNLDLAVHTIWDMVRGRGRGYICVAPVSTIVDARRDPEYRKVVNQAALVTPDGIPVVWLGRRKGFREVSRTYGPDLMTRLCTTEDGRGLKHFFYGGTSEVCDRLVQRLEEKFPDIIVAGTFAPEFMPAAEVVPDRVRLLINAARPDILWVALGAPKQDFWMALNRPLLDVPVMIGVGAAFDFLAGVKPQAPGWMQRIGLEWLFRLCAEPRRLWKRYLVGNSLFIWWLLLDAMCPKSQGHKVTMSQSHKVEG